MAAVRSAGPGAVPAPLGLWDVVSLIVGIIVGTTIFQSPPDIFANAGSPGLGLALCRDVIEAQGGALHVTSAEGHGTTVTLSFPPPAAVPPDGFTI